MRTRDPRAGEAAARRRELPGQLWLDRSAAFILDPYRYIARRCAHYGSEVFQERLLLRPTLCLRGAEAARLFYDETRFQRAGAAPRRLRKTLFGEGGVQGLDDEAHRARKALFMGLMGVQAVRGLGQRLLAEWEARAAQWPQRPRVVLYEEAAQVLCAAACAWTGVPLPPAELPQRAADFIAMIEGAGAVGPIHWRGRRARRRSERWIAAQVQAVRAGRLSPAPGSALQRFATETSLDARTAAVELINLLRPITAIAVYVAYIALALHQHPAAAAALRKGGEAERQCFVQEVRRYYPFFPCAAARVHQDFVWKGYRFRKGRRALLDLHGTCHDARSWEAPESFRPGRFAGLEPDAYAMIPQGGAGHDRQHRCAGEWITLELMKVSADFLARRLRYTLPPQRLALRRFPLPALPASGVVLGGITLRSLQARPARPAAARAEKKRTPRRA